MSSPLDRELGADEPSPYAPKWVREAAGGRRSGNPERSQPAAEGKPKPPDTADTEPLRSAGPALGGAKDTTGATESVIIDRYRLPPSLEPTVMSDPWPVQGTRSGLGLTIRFSVAAGIAALIALLVVGKFPIAFISGKAELQQSSPSFGSRFSGQNTKPVEAAKSATAQLIETQELPRERSDRIPPQGTVARAIDPGPVQAVATTASPPTASPPPVASRVTAPAPASAEPRAAVAPAPANAETRTPAAPAKSFVRRQLDREEITALIRRGDAFILSGDLASARLVLQRAAEAGDASAALKLAGTYDPIVLEKSGIQGFGSDIAAARTWYERAKEFGSAEATRRLEMLASWTH